MERISLELSDLSRVGLSGSSVGGGGADMDTPANIMHLHGAFYLSICTMQKAVPPTAVHIVSDVCKNIVPRMQSHSLSSGECL